MKQKTNGKIVIAILAMFAVAISVIGFTYAYFTATFNSNNQDKDVTVNAGKLVANFTGTNAIEISNVVPGWLSDGLSYYDPVLAQSNEGNVFASHLRPRNFVNPKAGEEGQPTQLAANASELYYSAELTQKNLIEASGLTAPIQFTVSNDENSPDTVSFYIRLKNISNELTTWINGSTANFEQKKNYAQDLVNFKVHLYEGIFDYNKVVDPNNLNETYLDDGGETVKYADTPYGGTLISTLVFGYDVASESVMSSKYTIVEPVEGASPGSVTLNTQMQSLQTLSTEPHTLAACTGNVGSRTCGTGTSKNFFVIFEYENAETLQLAQGASIGAEVEIVGVHQESGTWYNTDNEPVTFADSLHN